MCEREFSPVCPPSSVAASGLPLPGSPPDPSSMAPPPLGIQLFGPLRVTVRGEPMPRVRTRSVEWLLALLTLRHGRAVDRSWLAGTLWPESSGRQALENLRADLVRLRKALPVLAELGLTPEAVARSAARLERALVPIEELCRDFLARNMEIRAEGFAVIDLAAFRKLDDEVAIQLLERLLAAAPNQRYFSKGIPSAAGGLTRPTSPATAMIVATYGKINKNWLGIGVSKVCS